MSDNEDYGLDQGYFDHLDEAAEFHPDVFKDELHNVRDEVRALRGALAAWDQFSGHIDALRFDGYLLELTHTEEGKYPHIIQGDIPTAVAAIYKQIKGDG